MDEERAKLWRFFPPSQACPFFDKNLGGFGGSFSRWRMMAEWFRAVGERGLVERRTNRVGRRRAAAHGAATNDRTMGDRLKNRGEWR